MGAYKKDIFISYKNDGVGNNFATRLVNDLRSSGYSVYFNPDEAKGGNFPVRLKNAIEECKDFVCIVTSEYIKNLYSDNELCWVREELLCAKNNKKNIIPILVNGTTMPSNSADTPEELRFFSQIDAYTFPEQYIKAPFNVFCLALHSRNDGIDSYRDVYNSNPNFNPDDILAEILKEAKNGSIEAAYQAGVYYFNGISVEQNYREAAKWFLKVAESDDRLAPMACKFIGRMYYQGCMPREPQSYVKSFEYHKRAAETDEFSARHVASMMAIGSGCDYNYDETEAYFLSILGRCDNIGKIELCDLYCKNGEFKKAAVIYEEIADAYPSAAYELGLMYKNGVLASPPSPDYHKAAMHFQSAVDNGHLQAAYELALLYFNPTGRFKGDFSKAQKYFEIAANGGYDKAQYILGYMYEYGHVKKDISKAIEYYEKAFEQGNVLSAAHLGILYQQPEVHNYERAFTCCKYAADAGDTPAEFALGVLYLCGRGCEADPDKAYMCFKHASKYGAPEAEIMLEQMRKLGL